MIKEIKNYIINIFSKGHQRSIVAKKNIAASLLIKGSSVLINLALLPLTIDYVNPTQYGVWLTLSSIINWFSFLDIGLGNGLMNHFAEAKAKNDITNARKLVSTTYAVLSVIFIGFWLIVYIINNYISWSSVLNVTIGMEAELSKLALIVFSFFCLQMILRVINTIVSADQKTALAGLINLFAQLLVLILILIVTRFTSGSLINLGLILGLSPVTIFIISSFILFRTKYILFRPSFQYIDFKLTKKIMNIGLKFFLIQLSLILVLQTTNIIITQTMGPEYVTLYNIAYKYFFIVSMFFTIILVPFWPAFTEAFVKNDFVWMKNVLSKLQKIWLLVIPIILIMLFVSNQFYNLWIGDRVIIPIAVSVMMAIYSLIYTRANLYMYLINGTGKLKLQLYSYLISSVIFIPLALYLANKIGLIGIILANICVYLIIAIVSQMQIIKLVNNKAVGIWNQ